MYRTDIGLDRTMPGFEEISKEIMQEFLWLLPDEKICNYLTNQEPQMMSSELRNLGYKSTIVESFRKFRKFTFSPT